MSFADFTPFFSNPPICVWFPPIRHFQSPVSTQVVFRQRSPAVPSSANHPHGCIRSTPRVCCTKTRPTCHPHSITYTTHLPWRRDVRDPRGGAGGHAAVGGPRRCQPQARDPRRCTAGADIYRDMINTVMVRNAVPMCIRQCLLRCVK